VTEGLESKTRENWEVEKEQKGKTETHPHQRPRSELTRRNPLIHNPLQVPLQPPPKVVEHRASTRENNVRVESATNVDRRGLDHLVDDFGEGGEEVGGVNFRVEEDLGGEETLVTDVDRVFLRRKRE
jgi:hypothetical protein